MDLKNLIKIKGIWYYRVFIPTELQNLIGRKEIRKTLKTRNIHVAIHLRDKLHDSYRMAIRQVEVMSNTLSSVDLQKIIANYLTNAFEENKRYIFDYTYTSREHKQSVISEAKDNLAKYEEIAELNNAPLYSKELGLTALMNLLNVNPSTLDEDSLKMLENILVLCVAERQRHSISLMENKETLDRITDPRLRTYLDNTQDDLLAPKEQLKASIAPPEMSRNDYLLLSEIIIRFKEDKQSDLNKVSERTLRGYIANIDTLIFVIGDLTVDLIDKRKCAEFKAAASKIPKNRTTKFRDKTYKQLLKMTYEQISSQTVNNHLIGLGVVFGWAVKNGYMNDNPISGMISKPSKRKKNEHRTKNHPYDSNAIQKFFNSRCRREKG